MSSSNRSSYDDYWDLNLNEVALTHIIYWIYCQKAEEMLNWLIQTEDMREDPLVLLPILWQKLQSHFNTRQDGAGRTTLSSTDWKLPHPLYDPLWRWFQALNILAFTTSTPEETKTGSEEDNFRDQIMSSSTKWCSVPLFCMELDPLSLTWSNHHSPPLLNVIWSTSPGITIPQT